MLVLKTLAAETVAGAEALAETIIIMREVVETVAEAANERVEEGVEVKVVVEEEISN